MISSASIYTNSRNYLHDTVSPYRWDDSKLKKALELAIRTLKKRRPEFFIQDDGTLADDDLSALADLPEHLEDALTAFVNGKMLGEDSADVENMQRSMEQYKYFNEQCGILKVQ